MNIEKNKYLLSSEDLFTNLREIRCDSSCPLHLIGIKISQLVIQIKRK